MVTSRFIGLGEFMERVLALDVGDKRIGFAVSDPLGMIANGIETYTRKTEEEDIRYICDMAESYRPVRLLFGMPRNMNGTYGPQSEKVRDLAEKVGAVFDGEIEFEDERMTTIIAERVLVEADLSRKKRRKVIDKVAAVVILQGYLDAHN